MTFLEELKSEEVQSLKKRYHELYGVWIGYHWNDYGSVEEYKEHMRKKIAEKEKELGY